MRMSVPKFQMDFVVAGTAQGHEVPGVVRSALGDGQDVVDLLRQRGASLLQTLLAQRMRRRVPLSYPPPRSAVGLVYVRVPLVGIVPPPRQFLMLCAVRSVREIGTAGKRAGLFQFSWQNTITFSQKTLVKG